MNILLLSWRDPKHPLAGGAEQVIHEHAKGWVEAGHNVTLFSSFSKDNKVEEVIDGVRIVRKGTQILGVHLQALIWYIFVTEENYDLVIDQFHGIPFFTPFYVRTKKLAVLQEVAKEVWFMNPLPRPLNWIIGAIGYITEPLIFIFYKNIPFMVGSHSAKEDLIKMNIPETNITVVPHGVIIKNSGAFNKEKTKTIIFLGALDKDKGIEDALMSFSLLKQMDKYQFWIVGKGTPDYTRYLSDLTKKLKIDADTKFWGFVDQNKKFELLKRAHILVNPSVREGWGLVNIEANAMGTPVVSYKSPGLTDSVKNEVSGIFCNENTPRSIADNVYKLLNNEKSYREISKSSVEWSENFSWEKSRKISLNLIRKLVFK
jgi:glycosyltransferase involved in cell wall biosynthesis